jgi:hypothetical protein
VSQLRHHIEERLNQAMTYFYPIHDREAGYVQRSVDEGDRVNVPFMRISTVILSQKDVTFSSVESLREALSQPVSA